MASPAGIDITTNPLKRGRGRPAKPRPDPDPFRPASTGAAGPASSAADPSDAARAASEARENARVVLDPPERVEVPPAAEPDKPLKRKRKTLFDVQELTDLGCHVAAFNQAMKPPVLRPIWEISRAEVQEVAEPLAEILERMPDKYLEVASKVLDLSAPLALMGAVYKMVAPRRAQQAALIAELEAEYARQSMGGQSGGHIRTENGAAPPGGPAPGGFGTAAENPRGGNQSAANPGATEAYSTGIPFSSDATDILSNGFRR